MGLLLTVIIITYRRPEHVRRCLTHLTAQREQADQILVIDASEDRGTADVVAEFAAVEYLHNARGAGNMTSSRNRGLELARGDVIAFLDDDAYAEPDYLAKLRQAYSDETVGLACSRTLNGQPGEETVAVGGVGKLLRNSYLAANFAFDTGANVDIDHGVGATMSFRRSTLERLGGFREDYRGFSGLREDTDVFLRARELGFRAVFVHEAVAHHVAAPQAKGRRFGLHYEYLGARNHALLVANNYGLFNLLLPRYAAAYISWSWRRRGRILGRVARTVVGISGFVSGGLIAIYRHRGCAVPADLQTARAAEIRMALRQVHADSEPAGSA